MQPWVKTLAVGPMKNFAYLVGAPGSDTCAVIDAAWEPDTILRAAGDAGRRITHLLATHRHHDHVNALPDLLQATDARVYAHRDDAPHLAVDVPRSSLVSFTAGEQLELGSLTLVAVHTPGHTPGSTCWLHDGNDGAALFTGDTLFVNACGRCDFEHSDVRAMHDSLFRVLGALPGHTTMFPGHDYGDVPVSTLDRERQNNPYLQLPDLHAFIARRLPNR